MDIAKIRKKLKGTEANSQQSKVNPPKADQKKEEGKTAIVKSEEKKPELRGVEADLNQKAEAIGKEGTKAQGIKGKIEGEKPDDIIEILTFSLLKEEFAFRVSQLEEILRPQKITLVPKMPNYVIGITSLRGKIIPVIDLKTKLSLTDKPSDINHRGKILIIKGPKGPIGAAIDKVVGVVRIAKSEIIPPPSHLTETELKFIEGIAIVDKRFISIIQMEEAIKI